MNVFICAIVRVFSFGERLIVSFNSAITSLNGTINLSPHENILTIALIYIHYLYNVLNLLSCFKPFNKLAGRVLFGLGSTRDFKPNKAPLLLY